MTLFKYHDSPVTFEVDYLGTGECRVSTLAHGELGFIWEESNGGWSAKVGNNVVRHVGNSAAAFKWLIDNQ